jgi:twitching motility protein PilT
MIPNPAIRNLIREDKVHQIYSVMQAGQEKSGMQTMNQSLLEQFLKRTISREVAIGASQNSEELQQMMHRSQSPGAATGGKVAAAGVSQWRK